ncbi:MAG: phage Gp37/Gp68 family protein [Tepidisphaeraceae bacterium]
MALGSAIEWTDATWNPVTGCTKISPGCKHCYAERMANRLRAMGQPRYANGFKVTLQPDVLELPLQWRLPRTIFVNSMSDLFHRDVPNDYILKCFDIMRRAPQHIFQVLTKRPERVVEMASKVYWAPNIWMGTSIENQDYVWRADLLAKVPATIRFLSIEPLLGPVKKLPLDECKLAGVHFFFKQWGGVQKGKTGRRLEGREWNEIPALRGISDGERPMAAAM